MQSKFVPELSVLHAGRKQNRKGKTVTFPWEEGWKKPIYEVWYVFNGQGELRVDGGDWSPIRPGMMVWMHKDRFYEWRQDPDKPLGTNFFHFRILNDSIQKVESLPETIEATDPPFVENLSRRVIELYWEEYFEKVVKDGAQPDSRRVPSPHFENEPENIRKDLFLPPVMSLKVPEKAVSPVLSLALSLFQGLVGEYLHLARKRLSEHDVGVHRFHRQIIGEVVAGIQGNLANVPTVGEMAANCGYGIDHFGRIFRKVMGCNAQEFVIKARIARARQLLLESGLSVKEIAAELGYASPFFFSRQFKSSIGESPSEFRQRHGHSEPDSPKS